MLKSNYQWNDKELESFYNHVATRRPSEQNRGGGYRITTYSWDEVDKINENLDILLYYEKEFMENGFFKQSKIVSRIRSKIFQGVYRWNADMLGEITIPDENRGRELVNGKLSRTMRVICDAFDSVLNRKPNENARAFFANI